MSQRIFIKSEDGSGPERGMSAEYDGRDGHHISPPGNPMKRNNLEEDRQVGRETN